MPLASRRHVTPPRLPISTRGQAIRSCGVEIVRLRKEKRADSVERAKLQEIVSRKEQDDDAIVQALIGVSPVSPASCSS